MVLKLPILVLVVAVCLAAGGATCGARPVSDLPTPVGETREVLGPGDVVEVRVFNEPELSGTHQVTPNGSIRLPLVGVVAAAGITPDELTVRIEQAYNERYLKNADVSLLVREFNSRKVYVLGQVAKPGQYPFDGKLTVIGAIARAGGTLKTADSNRALLTRGDDDGEQVRVVVEISAIERGQAPDVELLPGDIIYVPESPL